MKSELTKEEFLRCVQNHQMEVLLDNGVYRHLQFKAPETGNRLFHLVTFPGRLVCCGDMGSYLFERTEDMFKFFRREELSVNLGYWSEKVDAQDRDGVTEFSIAKAKELIEEIVMDETEALEEADRRRIGDELQDLLDSIDSDAGDVGDVLRIARDFDGDHIDGDWFCDLWESSMETYTYRFQWACFAIVWGINQYDKSNAISAAVS